MAWFAASSSTQIAGIARIGTVAFADTNNRDRERCGEIGGQAGNDPNLIADPKRGAPSSGSLPSDSHVQPDLAKYQFPPTTKLGHNWDAGLVA